MKRALYFIPVLIVFVGLIIFGLQLKDISEGKDIQALDSAMAGKPMPSFQLADLQHPEQIRTLADLPEGPFLINVWATWCPSCKAEHPYLVKLAQEKRIPIIGLNYKDERGPALAWLDKLGDPYMYSLFDGDGMVGFDLGVYGAPETFVIGADRIILHRHVGVVNETVWQEVILPLISTTATAR